MFRRAIAATVLGAVLCTAPAAFANTYTVTAATGEGGACNPVVNNATACTSLRAAFQQAATAPGSNTINLPVAGPYTLSQGAALALTQANVNVTINGLNARQTMIQGTTSQVFTVGAGTTLQLNGMTVSGGTSTQPSGGNILNSGTLALNHVRVSGGTAPMGGGVATIGGVTTITNSLVDGNTASNARGLGGGLLNIQGSATTAIPSRLTLVNTTVALNRATGSGFGGGIATSGGVATTSLTSVTVARNTAGTGSGAASAGLYQPSGVVQVTASIVADNFLDNGAISDCGDTPPTSVGQNLSTTACGFSKTADPLLDQSPSNQSGQTDVFAFPTNSPAARMVASCPVSTDQRDVARVLGGVCDAGAYESPAQQPSSSPSPSPTPTPPPSPPPAPVFHKSVVVTKVSGTVKVKLPGTNKFVDISKVQSVPLGATIDVKHGKIDLTSAPKAGGKPQTALFYGGIFKITQPGGITQLQLTEKLAACPRGRAASVAAKKPKTRSLWGDGHGAFRTKGHYSAATVRGTKWFVEDSCVGTLTKVVHGVVSVRDDVRHRNITLRAGKKYLARPRR
jgi:hypothetical protein